MRSFTREGAKRVLLERLVLSNFKRFKEQEILFRDGITGIIGNNGTGKSTIVEAILFALYGLSGTGLRPEFIVSSFAQPRERCEIRLDFRMRGNEYAVIRYFRRGSTPQHEVKLFAGKKLLAQGVSQVDEEIVRLTGMNAHDFKNTIYAGQRDLILLLESRPGERREWFSRALGLEDLRDKSQSLLKERIDAAERRKDLLQGELGGLKTVLNEEELKKARSMVNSLTHVLADYIPTLHHLNQEKSRIQEELNTQLEERSYYFRLTEQLESVTNRLGTLQQRKEILSCQIEELIRDREEFEHLSSDRDSYLKVRDVMEREREKKQAYNQLVQERRVLDIRIGSIEEQLRQIRQRIKQMETAESARSNLLFRIRHGAQCPVTQPDESLGVYLHNKHGQLTAQVGALHGAMEDAARRREELLRNRDTLRSAGSEGICPLCHQVLGDHYSHIESDYDEQLMVVMKEAEATCSQLERLETEKEELDLLLPLIEDLQRFNERLMDRSSSQMEYQRLDEEKAGYEAEIARLQHDQELLGYKEDTFQALENKLKELDLIHERYQSLGRKIAPLPVIDQQIAILSSDIQEMGRERDILGHEIERISYDPQRVPRLQEMINSVQYRITSIERDRARDLERKNKAEEMITRYIDLETRIEGIMSELTIIEEEVRFLRMTRATIAEFVVYLMQVVRSQIEWYAGEILSEITGRRYERVLLDSDFNIRVSDLDDDYPIERFSGGEQDDIAVALRIALSRYLAELHQIHDSTFLIFDEIFGSQDEERRNNLLRALRTQEPFFPQIILISHIPEIQGEFSTTLVVEMGNNLVSTVREVS